MNNIETHVGDCLDVLGKMQRESVDLAYVDPPFFTQKTYNSVTRDGGMTFSFQDIWNDENSYANFIYQRIVRVRDVLKNSGSLFFHCDKSASHIIRLLLDNVFGSKQFQSEIIWSFRRWSNTRKGLLPAHHTIFFYSKTGRYKLNTLYQDYSTATNIDQTMQKRIRDFRNKTVYARDLYGRVVGNATKKGVPLSDVWDMPFLNPKARERVGFPTQKPILLMRRIIELVTEEGDIVLDPFCGSGTTLVAATLLNRNGIGIDIDCQAIRLTKRRLVNPIMTKSKLLEKGRASYRQHSLDAQKYLCGVPYIPVQRNKGIDGLLKGKIRGLPVFIRVQRKGEPIRQAIAALQKATKNKGPCKLVVVATGDDLFNEKSLDVHIVQSTALAIDEYINQGGVRTEPTSLSVARLLQKPN